QLQGNIPGELGQLSNLETLNVTGNELRGPIPPELGQLSKLLSLSLSNNQLSGNIPSELGDLGSLRHLYLEFNQLGGNIPGELGRLSNLETLNVIGNKLSGPIPPEIGQLSNLETLSLNELGENQFSGPIPPEIGQLDNLRYLALGQNQLNGSIPAEIGQLSNLEHLNLNQNLLSGPIPPEIGQLGSLRVLYLGSNQLRGRIPSEIGYLSNLELLDLGENELSGLIPQEFRQLLNLRELSLIRNFGIVGTLPYDMRKSFVGGELNINANLTQIHGFSAPPERMRTPSYSENSGDNGNASHSSIAYFQGPLTLEQEFGGEAIEFQTPILGRRAMLAVSVLHEVSDPPALITRVLDSNDLILDENLVEAAYPVTKSTEDGGWLTEYYFDLPGEYFQAGNKFAHVIDPDNELAETNEEDNVWEPFVVYGEESPRLRVSFIPIKSAMDEKGWHEGFDLDPIALMAGIVAILPIADDFEARIGPAYELNAAEDSFGALRELFELWNLEAQADEFYHGIISGDLPGPPAAFASGQVAVSWLYIGSTIPHEFGHNLSLAHPPGCGAEVVDDNYPYPEGKLGPTVAWDFNWRRFASSADERFGDVMSYCTDIAFISISDYHYRKATEYWLSFGSGISTRRVSTSSVITEERESQTFTTSEARSLALSGRISAGGAWSLTQTQFSQRDPRLPAANVEFTLILLDSAGVRVYAEPLSIAQISDSDESLWAARTPLPVRPPREILILDSQGNEVLRQSLPELE
ncbi:MAG: hypothetical protein F4195_07475, partial [Gammaproteobacteria bacterium]|nr:hypothetical protein [Gammaproteobacteria bacterium]